MTLGGALSPGTVNASVDEIHIHPSFSRATFSSDLALLRLAEPVSATATVRPVCLPDPGVDPRLYKVCVDTGFGQAVSGGERLKKTYFRFYLAQNTQCT